MALTIIKISKESFAAHNKNLKMPGGNEHYNKAYKLGVHLERMVLRHAATSIYGMFGVSHKLTKKDIADHVSQRNEVFEIG